MQGLSFENLPKPIIYGLFALIVIAFFYFLSKPDRLRFLLGKEPKEDIENSIQLKGQILFDGIPINGITIKLKDHSDLDSKVFLDGKFKFEGVPYNKENNVKYIQIVCPEDQRHVVVKIINLNNKGQFREKDGWIDLGQIDVVDPCSESRKDEKCLMHNRLIEALAKIENALMDLSIDADERLFLEALKQQFELYMHKNIECDDKYTDRITSELDKLSSIIKKQDL